MTKTIKLWQEENWWVIKHVPTGVTTQGRTQIEALLMLADALSGYWDDISPEELLQLSEEIFTPPENI